MNDLELDVRPILRHGGEPVGAIMTAVGQLTMGQRLKLFATFKPVPLFDVMARRGFAHEARALNDGDWMVIFTPVTGERRIEVEADPENPDTWPDPARYLDCNALGSEPMGQILASLETLAEGKVLFALLGCEPSPLFAELKARDHTWVSDFDEVNGVYRLMIRAGRPERRR